jgi:predicted cation transporter
MDSALRLSSLPTTQQYQLTTMAVHHMLPALLLQGTGKSIVDQEMVRLICGGDTTANGNFVNIYVTGIFTVVFKEWYLSRSQIHLH